MLRPSPQIAIAPLVGLAVAGVFAAALGAAGACAAREGEDDREVVVYAAASLRDVLTELGDAFATETGATPVFNFAGSNVLARQIAAAPGADVFLSANEKWMDRLEAAGRIEPGTRHVVLSNRLVLVAPAASALRIATPADLARAPFDHLVLADPRGVPAGIYAREYLESVTVGADPGGGSLWDAVAPRVVPAADVRAALGMVETHPRAIAFVYRSDLHSALAGRGERGGLRVLYEVPPEAAPAIRYSAAVVRGSPRAAAARRYLAFLAGPKAAAAFAAHGFAPLPGA